MNTKILPEGYKEYKKIDLANHKKDAIIVNLAALMIAVIMIFPTNVPFNTFVPKNNLISLLLKIISLLAAIFGYIILHEAVHGITLWLLSGSRPYFGFKSTYAYTRSDMYLDRPSYITIALAPMIILGIILLTILFSVPIEWFWFVYLLVIFNFSGSAGDLYVAWLMLRIPKDALMKDEGVKITVYTKVKITSENLSG